MTNIVKPNEDSLNFEVTSVDPKTAQLARNVESFFDSSLILIGEDGRLTYYNTRAINLFEIGSNFDTEDVSIWDLINYFADRGDFGEGDRKAFIEVAAKIITPENKAEAQFAKHYLTMPSGNILRVLLYRNTDNTVALSAQDVSEQRRNENMLKIALDIGLAGYLIFDTHQKVCRLESRYLSNLLTSDEKYSLETSGPSFLFHPDDLLRSQEMWGIVRKTGETESETLRLITKNAGVRWFNFVLMLESEATNSNRIVAFFSDVTDSLRQQESLSQAKSLAEETLASKDNFLARMSHEVRTPMNAVIGMTDALIHHHANPEITPQLELIMKSATSILKLLDETLTHSRLNTDSFSLDPAPASPAEVVRDVCALWEQQALKNNGIIRCIVKDQVPETIVFDKFRYEQCVNNLLSNAVKFTQNGKIDVILTVVHKEAQTPYLVLAVRDTGIGMTTEQQNRIFEAYAQADQSIFGRFGGTGLGMNITKQIVERMGGTISVRSEIGSGTMFALSIPIVDVSENIRGNIQDKSPAIEKPFHAKIIAPAYIETSAVENRQQTPITVLETQNTSTNLIENMLTNAKPKPTAYSALKVLVVDDNPTNHLVIKSLLGSMVAEVVVANNGAEALEVLDGQDIDIVLMDIHMPVMDGIECTLAIRSSDKSWKDVTIIALTADPQYQQKKLCKNIGMDEALAKPVRLNDLIEAIDNVLPQKTDTIEQGAIPSELAVP